MNTQNTQRRTQKSFVAVTLLTVLAVTTVFMVYAAIQLGVRTGGEVSVGGVSGTIYYSTSKTGPWTSTTISVTPAGTAWYAVLTTPGNEYIGPVTISWQLWKKGSLSNWSDATTQGAAQSTSIVLTSSSQTIYAEPNGASSDLNFNWGATGFGDVSASYRIIATISSTG